MDKAMTKEDIIEFLKKISDSEIDIIEAEIDEKALIEKSKETVSQVGSN